MQISVGNDQQAGRMEAYRVDRAVLYNSKAYFHHFMNKPNKMLRDLALHLFDRHGHLESHLCGLFGAETDSGGLILIRCDSVKPHQAQDKAMSQGVQQLLVKLQHQTNNETSWTLAGRTTLCVSVSVKFDHTQAISATGQSLQTLHTVFKP